MWYSPNAQLTYNRIFNFCVGVRGGGKTFNTILHCLKKSIDSRGEWQFLYVRRNQVDLDESCAGGKDTRSLFADIQYHGYYQDHDLKVAKTKSGGYNFYDGDTQIGFGVSLSTAGSRRSIPYPKVNLIVFDEFLIDSSTGSRQKYLNRGEEFFVFANLYETVARGRDIPCVFIGNAFSMVNPYFLALDIRITDIVDNKIYKGDAWTFISWRDPDFIAEREKTQFFQATKGTKFSAHAYGNTYYLDNKEFLRKRDPESEHYFSLEYLGKKWGVWVDWNKGRFYVSKKGAEAPKHKTLSLSLADNRPNNVTIRKYRNYPAMKLFRSAVEGNMVYYDSQEAYNNISEVIYLMKTIT